MSRNRDLGVLGKVLNLMKKTLCVCLLLLVKYFVMRLSNILIEFDLNLSVFKYT